MRKIWRGSKTRNFSGESKKKRRMRKGNKRKSVFLLFRPPPTKKEDDATRTEGVNGSERECEDISVANGQ